MQTSKVEDKMNFLEVAFEGLGIAPRGWFAAVVRFVVATVALSLGVLAASGASGAIGGIGGFVIGFVTSVAVAVFAPYALTVLVMILGVGVGVVESSWNVFVAPAAASLWKAVTFQKR
jgi:hypothetical protein